MLTVATVKQSLHIDTDYDDALLERLIVAAGDHLKSIGVNMDADPLPPVVQQAQLVLIDYFYGGQTINIEFDRLIAPYREHGL